MDVFVGTDDTVLMAVDAMESLPATHLSCEYAVRAAHAIALPPGRTSSKAEGYAGMANWPLGWPATNLDSGTSPFRPLRA
jgi:hypothetical protein